MNKRHKGLLPLAAAVGVTFTGLWLTMGTGLAAHPPIELKTYDEVAVQYGVPYTTDAKGNKVPTGPMPVIVGGNPQNPMQGFPYSPKATCGSCHNGTTVAPSTGKVLKSYEALADHAFHSALGANEWNDSPTGGFDTTVNRQKPWNQTKAMWGKW
ncbi:hypothetical protein [Geotalea sp. SG265]|uniref:hypothetical protein n=1 Tax=Geotalea sp. SG265 TaxID=2922867 RepID=UPI001FAE83A4|nr:hypothetical protein [Geotalea sp. SG265]